MTLALAETIFAVTRPAQQAHGLIQGLQAQGAGCLAFPLLTITPTDRVEDRQMLERICQALSDYDLAFFVSANAVRFALDFVLAHRAWPTHVAVSTVGEASEAALGEYGFSQVIVPRTGFDSESVLALPAFLPEAVRGRRVVIFRGDGGRTLLADKLVARGASVTLATCYLRRFSEVDPQPLLACWALGDLSGIILTSSEAVGYLPRALGAHSAQVLRTTPAFAPHPRVLAAAQDVGFSQTVLTPAGDGGIIQGLIQYVQNLPKTKFS